MRYHTMAAALAAASLAVSARAGSGGQHMSPGHRMSHAQIEQHLRHDLTRAGFTDIHVMPESFLIRAKNAQGLPVMMVINPDSVTEVTAMKTSRRHGASSGQGNTGAGTTGTVGGNAGKTNQ